MRFIEARRTLNALQQQRIDGTATALADAFDQQQARVSVESQERQATATINRIPAPRRAVFEAELTDRVAQAQEGAGAEAAADRLTLERQVLDEFLALAHGRGTTGPDAERAAVPCEGRVWFSFPPEVIDALPAEDAYGLAGTTTRRGLRLRVIGFVVALLAMGAVWFASTRAWGQEIG
ncbi:hypothetical protein HGA89_04530, partial [bacterium]|nr:hypothetical protein [bacterium]